MDVRLGDFGIVLTSGSVGLLLEGTWKVLSEALVSMSLLWFRVSVRIAAGCVSCGLLRCLSWFVC